MRKVPASVLPAAEPGHVPPPVDLMGTPLHPVTMSETIALVDRAILTRRPLRHLAMNAAKLVALRNDPALRASIEAADLITADGQSIVWASRLLGRPVPERVTGIDLMHGALDLATRKGYRVFTLGARADVVRDAVEVLQQRFPGLRMVGAIDGYFTPAQEPAVVRRIVAARPDMLFVALSSPKKERFLAEHEGEMGVPFCMGVGGSLDVIAGRVRRAPRLLQRLGLEWLFRLAQEPRRLWRRYLQTNTQFLALLLRETWRVRRPGGAPEGLPSERG
jgi:N-acetylglucosaminyldiphosphoundecaprenol N-acetyl-beta-D-mannosaminyltransferase